MTISAVGGTAQSYLSQLYSTQQAQAVSAVSVDVPANTGASPSATDASAGNSLTGTGSSNLDSQTLQALLDLTQQDPSDPSQQSGQAGQTQGAHHHRHHHGGGAQPAPASSTPATTAAGTDSASTDAESADSSLESVLLAA